MLFRSIVRSTDTTCVQLAQPGLTRSLQRAVKHRNGQDGMRTPEMAMPSRPIWSQLDPHRAISAPPRANLVMSALSKRMPTAEVVKMACEPPRWLCHLGPCGANLIRAARSRPFWSQLDPCHAISAPLEPTWGYLPLGRARECPLRSSVVASNQVRWLGRGQGAHKKSPGTQPLDGVRSRAFR